MALGKAERPTRAEGRGSWVSMVKKETEMLGQFLSKLTSKKSRLLKWGLGFLRTSSARELKSFSESIRELGGQTVA